MSKIPEAVYIELIRSATEIAIRAEFGSCGRSDVIDAACKFLKEHFAVREPMTEEQRKAQYEEWRRIVQSFDKPIVVEGKS